MHIASTMNCYIHTAVITLLSICPGYLYGQRTTHFVDRKDDTYVNNGFLTVTVDSVMKCCTMCGMNVDCRSLSFNKASSECQLNDKHLRDASLEVFEGSGWTSFFEYVAEECPENWSIFENRCYLLVELNLTWSDSQNHCQSIGGNLAVPHTVEHVDQYFSMVESAGYIWIGISDVASEEIILAENDYTIPPVVGFMIISNNDDNDCGCFSTDYYGLQMTECTQENKFICERDKLI